MVSKNRKNGNYLKIFLVLLAVSLGIFFVAKKYPAGKMTSVSERYIKNSKNLKKVLLKYDVFFVDNYGVLYSGKEIIEGALNFLDYLKKQGKTIIILSNASRDYRNTEKKLKSIGLERGTHYDLVVTSGDVANTILRQGGDIFNNTNPPKKWFILGRLLNGGVFDGTDYEITTNLEEADAVYLGCPQLDAKKWDQLSEEERKFTFESTIGANDEIYYDVLNVDFFRKDLEKIRELSLPVFVDNSDEVAPEADRKTGVIHNVIRQGALGNEYESMGGIVRRAGKPGVDIYKYAINLAVAKGFVSKTNSPKCLMIDDTMETGILGAQNANENQDIRRSYPNLTVDSMWTRSGISNAIIFRTREYLRNDEDILRKIEEYCGANNIAAPHYVVDSVGVIIENK